LAAPLTSNHSVPYKHAGYPPSAFIYSISKFPEIECGITQSNTYDPEQNCFIYLITPPNICAFLICALQNSLADVLYFLPITSAAGPLRQMHLIGASSGMKNPSTRSTSLPIMRTLAP
jgi:hypothetical protein